MPLLSLLILTFVGSAIGVSGPHQENELNGHALRKAMPAAKLHRAAVIPTRVQRADAIEDMESEQGR
ncbi:hypothetical protein N7471_002566 [Penicillium samsonianum]|uniref:uncharacterized protein n=1 Tax=Penicillium samsonianum TaxID=1882272 RepID=UPI002547D6BF|nr:uncharacterized protein N7471_002566 [Penicillium samsonianum]KAJ6143113.1 hypothetical protein N7471_002566 [Penicillium samsonianum]